MKKEQGLSLNVIIAAAIILIMLTILLSIFIRIGDKFNLENDVCLEWGVVAEDIYNRETQLIDYCSTENGQTFKEDNRVYCKRCLDWRKKTVCELNPNDQDRCACDAWEETDEIIGGYACPNSCRDITIKECEVNGLYSYGKKIEIKGRIIFDDNCEIRLPIEALTDIRNLSMNIYEKNITNCIQCYEYEKTCIKAHEKNECEKENPEWIWKELKPYNRTKVIDGTIYYTNCDIDYAFHTTTNQCIPLIKKQICKKKTIQDLTCEELDREFNCWGKFKCNNLFEDCDKDCDLYWMIKKGC